MITFGRFGHVEDREKEKEYYLKHLNYLLFLITGGWDENKYKEIEIIKPLKEILKRNENSFFNIGYKDCLCGFLESMGLSYYNLTPKEKEEIIDMDFTYENWEKKSLELIENFIERTKNACPQIIRFIFDDVGFVFHIQIIYHKEFRLKDLPIYIRDYFILDYTTDQLKELRDKEKYDNIKRKAINIYPIIRERYGMNKFLVKFLNYIGVYTNYDDDEKIRNILNKYYKKNNKIENDESIKFKDKQD